MNFAVDSVIDVDVDEGIFLFGLVCSVYVDSGSWFCF